jgi:dienelactone hydrolase
MRWDVLETRREPAYELRRLRYTLSEDEWGYGWLGLPARGGVRGAVIAVHQTVPQGKDEPVGLEGDPELAYGRELVEGGFAVLAPDAIGFGERRMDHANAKYHSADSFFAAHPEGSVMGKMAFDTSRAVDLLETMEETRGLSVGCIGHSHGGYGTLFAMIADDRIRAAVISCGVTPLRTDPTPDRWWRRTALIPRLGLYEEDIYRTPLDFHHWLAMLAPRPVMVVAALNDSIFPNLSRFPHLVGRVREVYRLCGAAGALHPWVFHGPHQFPRRARARAYSMLADTLQMNG